MMGRQLVVLVACLLLSAYAQQNCPYSETGLQSFNTLYGSATTSTSDILINSKVILDVANITVRKINITDGGQLIFKDVATTLQASVIFVGDGGALRIGSATCPLKANIVITLYGARSTQNDMADERDKIVMGTKGIGVSSGGSIDVHGTSPSPAWTRLSKHANKNDTTITLQKAVDWKIGSSIIIATTDYPSVYLGAYATTDPVTFNASGAPNLGNVAPKQNEERIITGVSTDRRTLTLDLPLNFAHYGLNDMSAEVGLLTRNIRIQGDDSSEASFFGGHIMVRDAVAARFTAVELYHMGQKGVVGRYPLHFHLMGSGIDPANRYIKDSAVHDLYQRCIVVHTSHGVMIKNNVAYNTNGHCYFLEDGPETYNTFDGNLGILANPIFAADPDGVSRRIIVADAAPSIFWIVNPNNTLINNVAVEAQNGFWYALPDEAVGATYGCCPGVVPRTTPLLSFKDNVAHSTGSGLFVDKGILHGTPAGMVAAKTNYAPTVPAYFDGFIAYKSRDFGIWTQSENVHVINAKLYDNNVGARMIAGRNSLQNAIVAIDTDNYGLPPAGRNRSRPIWRYDTELMGWAYYDHGSQSIRNVTFIGFTPTSQRAASAIYFPCQPHPHNSFMRVENVKYVNSVEFKIPNITTCYERNYDNLKAVNVMDTDGSTTGWVGGWIVSNIDIHKYSGCVPVPQWPDTAKCPPTFEGYVRTQINVAIADVPPIINSSFPGQMLFVPLEQSGAAPVTLRGDSTLDNDRQISGYNFATNLKNTRSYLVRWISNSVSTRMNLRMGEYGQPGEWVVLIFPYPKSAVLTLSSIYTKVDSLNELVSSTYFYDNTKELLYVRLSIDEENNNGNPRGTWANWAHYTTGAGVQLTILANCSAQGLNFCQAPESNKEGFSVPLPSRREQLFKADLSTCSTPQSVSYRSDIYLNGTAFLSYDPKTSRLQYHIMHNIGQSVSKMLVQYQETPGGTASVELELPALPVAPIKGFTYLSRSSHQKLVAGKLRIVFTTDSSPNGVLFGYFGCVGTCSLPEAAVNVSASVCSDVAVNSTVDIYVNGNFAKSPLASAGGVAYVVAPSNDSVTGVCGTKPIKAFIANNYVNVGLTPSFDLDAKFKFLEFWVKVVVPTNGQSDLFVVLRNTGQIGTKVRIVKGHLNNHAITDDWTRVRIPLTDFNVTSTIKFSYLQFTQVYPNNARPIYYFDQIRFSSISDPAPVKPTTPTSVAQYTANQCAVTEGEGGSDSSTSSTTANQDVDGSAMVLGAAWCTLAVAFIALLL